jgi:hypothetical protein
VARVPADADTASLTVAARTVLLDALEALDAHRQAVVVVGAQAVYLRSQDADFTVAAYTTDGDLTLDPARLGDEPELNTAMEEAGFALVRNESGHVQPGKWVRAVVVDGVTQDIPVDLIVPASMDGAPKAKRGARIPPHAATAAMRTAGVEAAVADHDLMPIVSLDPEGDDRRIEANIAGIVALLIAKAFKIGDRLGDGERGRTHRLTDKDAGDVVRLMTVSRAREDVQTLQRLLTSPIAGEVAREGTQKLRQQFGTRAAPGVEMAVRALAGGSLPEDRIRDLCVAYIRELLRDVEP